MLLSVAVLSESNGTLPHRPQQRVHLLRRRLRIAGTRPGSPCVLRARRVARRRIAARASRGTFPNTYTMLVQHHTRTPYTYTGTLHVSGHVRVSGASHRHTAAYPLSTDTPPCFQQ